MPFAPWRRRTPIKLLFINFLLVFNCRASGCVALRFCSFPFAFNYETGHKDKPQNAPTARQRRKPEAELSSFVTQARCASQTNSHYLKQFPCEDFSLDFSANSASSPKLNLNICNFFSLPVPAATPAICARLFAPQRNFLQQ